MSWRVVESEQNINSSAVHLSSEEIRRRYMNERWRDVIPHPSVALIKGKRGSGKSVLGYALLEYLGPEYGMETYAIGLPENKWHLLPETIKPLQLVDLDGLPENAIIFIDEAAMLFYAREWKGDLHALMDKLVSISRQKDQIIIFATHTARKFDVALVMDCDAILCKEPSFLHAEFERREVKKITREALEKFQAITLEDRPKKCYVFSHTIMGEMLENPMPSFWSEELSKAFAGIEVQPEKLKKKKRGKPTASEYIDDVLERSEQRVSGRVKEVRTIIQEKNRKTDIQAFFEMMDRESLTVHARCRNGSLTVVSPEPEEAGSDYIGSEIDAVKTAFRGLSDAEVIQKVVEIYNRRETDVQKAMR